MSGSPTPSFPSGRDWGLPDRLQLDNGGPFVAPKGLGLIVRLCLQQGVMPRFIPAREPWRNGTVEHFNDTFDKRFFRQERFDSLPHLTERVLAFETFHNGKPPLPGHERTHAGRERRTERAAQAAPALCRAMWVLVVRCGYE